MDDRWITPDDKDRLLARLGGTPPGADPDLRGAAFALGMLPGRARQIAEALRDEGRFPWPLAGRAAPRRPYGRPLGRPRKGLPRRPAARWAVPPELMARVDRMAERCARRRGDPAGEIAAAVALALCRVSREYGPAKGPLERYTLWRVGLELRGVFRRRGDRPRQVRDGWADPPAREVDADAAMDAEALLARLDPADAELVRARFGIGRPECDAMELAREFRRGPEGVLARVDAAIGAMAGWAAEAG